LYNVFSLLLLAFLGHPVLNKALEVIIFIWFLLARQSRYLWKSQLLLYFCGLLHVA
jgi:hypothetical protein